MTEKSEKIPWTFLYINIYLKLAGNRTYRYKLSKIIHKIIIISIILSIAGGFRTRESLDREMKTLHELVLEACDQGTSSQAARVSIRISVLDVNDNSPEIFDPTNNIVSVRADQPPGTEVVRVRAFDSDIGQNSAVTYSILTGIYLQFRKSSTCLWGLR